MVLKTKSHKLCGPESSIWNEGVLLLVFLVKFGLALGRWSLLGQVGIPTEIPTLAAALLP